MSFKKQAKQAYKKLLNDNFRPLNRGDIMLTYCHGSIFAKLIRLKGIVDSGKCHVNHAELYLGSGHSIAAELTVNTHPIKKYFKGKHDVYIFHNAKLTQEQRNAIVAESLVYHGKFYDVLGIVGQALAFLTQMNFWTKTINTRILVYCSEMVAKIYRAVVSNFMPNQDPETVTPDNIYDFCDPNADWICSFKLVRSQRCPDIKLKPFKIGFRNSIIDKIRSMIRLQ